ncbi:MAG: ankyrin repeat domain-containing protein [Ectothiorhodospiraceae bacterium AqS1]|nr:ankyrin repeat domain-containing protein [Ectothiorhodospiraceae bacterium AqS1]
MTRIIALLVLIFLPFAGGNATTCNLHDAARNGNTTLVRNLLDAGCALEKRNENRLTPLLMAVRSNYPDIVRLLLDAGAQVDAKDGGGNTALYLASLYSAPSASYRARRAYIVRMLLDAGARVDAKNGSGATALFYAARHESDIVLEMLLEAGAEVESKDDFDETALHFAVHDGRIANIRSLLEAGADADAKTGGEANTPLTLAVLNYEDDPTIIRLLLEAGAEVNKKMSIRGYSDGVIVRSQDDSDWTVLHVAALHRSGSIPALIDAGADVNAKTIDGQTPLHAALILDESHEYTQVGPAAATLADTVRRLIAAGADINAKDNQGDTVLHIASRKGDADIVPLLISLGADERITNNAMHKPVFVGKSIAILKSLTTPGLHWPIKAYALGNLTSASVDTSARIGCLDKNKCRVFLDCTDKGGGNHRGSLDSDTFYAGDLDSIESQATVTLSASDIRALTWAPAHKTLDCALRSQQRIMAQVWSSTDDANVNTTAYRLSEAGKARIQFHVGEGSIPIVNLRCLAPKGEDCTNTVLECTADSGRERAAINVGTIARSRAYTISTASDADHRIDDSDKGWYSCEIESDAPFMVHATRISTKGDSISKTDTTSISME